MKLELWLKNNNVSVAAFARMIGVVRPTVYRYIHGERFPERTYMREISRVTKGQVRSNDFEDEPPPAPKKRKKRPPT